MLLSALAYAVMGASAHGLQGRCDWRLVAALRCLTTFALVLAIARRQRIRIPIWRPRLLWVRSLAGSAGVLCGFFTFPRLPVSDAVTLMNTAPLWIALLSALLLQERGSWKLWAAVGVGFGGVLVMEQPQLEGSWLAIVIGVLGAVASAVAMLGLRRVRDIPTIAVIAHFSGTASVVTCAVALIGFDVFRTFEPTLTTCALLAGVGLSGTLAQVALTRAYAVASPVRNAPISFSEIGFAALIDAAIWHRSFAASTLLGMAMVLAPALWLVRSAAPRSAAAVANEP